MPQLLRSQSLVAAEPVYLLRASWSIRKAGTEPAAAEVQHLLLANCWSVTTAVSEDRASELCHLRSQKLVAGVFDVSDGICIAVQRWTGHWHLARDMPSHAVLFWPLEEDRRIGEGIQWVQRDAQASTYR